MATWNSRSLTLERFKYCQQLGYDVLALTELWNNKEKWTIHSKNPISWTYSQPALDKETKQPLFPNDPAAGVGILLSTRVSKNYLGHGSPCNRICWVRLKGPTTNLFIIAVYLPHKARIKPSQSDTLATLAKLFKQIPKNDCTIILGDLNAQFGPCQQGYTGKWTSGEFSSNADSILDVMRMFGLSAINTMFQPKRW